MRYKCTFLLSHDTSNNGVVKCLSQAIEAMHANKMYNQMVIYWESCESGSMFSKLLPSDINVLAVTAANPRESSYACYEDSLLNTFLGDVFSVRWMEGK